MRKQECKMSDHQTYWNPIAEEISRSKIKRYPWSEILGQSLTKKVTECREKGWSAQTTKEHILSNVKLRMYLLRSDVAAEKAIRNLELGINCRYYEQGAAEKRKNEVQSKGEG